MSKYSKIVKQLRQKKTKFILSMLKQSFQLVRSLNPQLRVLFVTTLIYRVSTMAFPFLSAWLYAQEELPAYQVGVVVGAFGIGALVSDLLISPILRIMSASQAIKIGLCIYAIVLLFIPHLESKYSLVLMTFAWGMAYEMFTPSAFSMTIEYSAEENRKVAFSCNRLAINIGMAIGPALGGLIFAFQSDLVFYVNSVVVLMTLIYFSIMQRQLVSSGRSTRRDLKPEQGHQESTNRSVYFWSSFILSLPIHLAYALPPTVLSVYMVNGLGLEAYWVSGVYITNALLVTLFELPINNYMKHMTSYVSILIGYLLGAMGFIIMGIAQIGPMLILATVIWTLGELIVFPSLLDYISKSSGKGKKSRNLGLHSAGVNIGIIFTPAIVSLLTVQTGDPSFAWVSAGALVFISMVMLYLSEKANFLKRV
ncbi:MFS transporter [Chromohalobacter nigrandesensis]|uniref:MFS transporter n=1 Tax=Chromohalobacter nigrandesensis TaxID=119863 RepID=UPI001FF1E2CF|nr:MFS transporter [Chromohalobacter nigrandesensis]MCK0744263.1 MFS transporter [Chromohalobacter nigrandesensis]